MSILADLYPPVPQLDQLSPLALEMRGFRIKPGKTEEETLVQIEGGQYIRLKDAVRNGLLTLESRPFQPYKPNKPTLKEDPNGQFRKLPTQRRTC